jgi:tRNA nucleotidyltransferase (CCA-adding enzyme)
MSARLRVPAECAELARLTAKWHGNVHRVAELRPATILDLLGAADALRRRERLEQLIDACECDKLSRPGAGDDYPPRDLLREALGEVREVDAGAIASGVIGRAAAQGAPAGGEAIAKAVRSARLAALKRWRAARRATADQMR